MKTKRCRCCEGTGKELDHKAVGVEMRNLRLSRKLSQAHVARRMGYSPPYVCDLEIGHRNWTEEKIEQYREACEL